jgi:hypothetical protein
MQKGVSVDPPGAPVATQCWVTCKKLISRPTDRQDSALPDKLFFESVVRKMQELHHWKELAR